MSRIYLDYAATTPVHPDVLKAMAPYFTEKYGNPSSIHAYGQEARSAVENAREKAAGLIGARAEEIVFTGGGTEADNIALRGAAEGRTGGHLITTVIEHHAVLETTQFLEKNGFKVTYLHVDKYGMVDPDDVKKALKPETFLISVMHANNEIGTIQPVEEIGKIAREAGVLFHTDAVQTTGHIPIDVAEMGVSLLAMSAHKLYGPKGVGALFIKKGTKLAPLVHGGGQEKGWRSGTENVPGIVGLGEAAAIARQEIPSEAARLTALRDRFIAELQKQIPEIKLNGHPVNRLPNNINISVSYVEGESMVLSLDSQGIAVSTGSACSSGNLEPSHVLLAAGCSPEQAHGSLRFTMGKWTIEEDIKKVLEVFPPIVKKLRAMSPLGNL